jgi:uncharacterized protein (DUF433 family)
MPTTASWISKQPDRCGGDACVRDSRITVWGLLSYRRLGMSDAEILRAVQGLTPADLEAAWSTPPTTRRKSAARFATTKRARRASWSDRACCSTPTRTLRCRWSRSYGS